MELNKNLTQLHRQNASIVEKAQEHLRRRELATRTQQNGVSRIVPPSLSATSFDTDYDTKLSPGLTLQTPKSCTPHCLSSRKSPLAGEASAGGEIARGLPPQRQLAPHSVEMVRSEQGKVGLIFFRDEGITSGPWHIWEIVRNSPADNSGCFRVGDAILAVDGASVLNLGLQETAGLFAGLPNSRVTVLLQADQDMNAKVKELSKLGERKLADSTLGDAAASMAATAPSPCFELEQQSPATSTQPCRTLALCANLPTTTSSRQGALDHRRHAACPTPHTPQNLISVQPFLQVPSGMEAANISQHINLFARGHDGSSISLKIRKNARVQKLMEAYCKHREFKMTDTFFLFKGTRLNGMTRADELQMQDGDVIEARHEAGVASTPIGLTQLHLTRPCRQRTTSSASSPYKPVVVNALPAPVNKEALAASAAVAAAAAAGIRAGNSIACAKAAFEAANAASAAAAAAIREPQVKSVDPYILLKRSHGPLSLQEVVQAEPHTQARGVADTLDVELDLEIRWIRLSLLERQERLRQRRLAGNNTVFGFEAAVRDFQQDTLKLQSNGATGGGQDGALQGREGKRGSFDFLGAHGHGIVFVGEHGIC